MNLFFSSFLIKKRISLKSKHCFLVSNSGPLLLASILRWRGFLQIGYLLVHLRSNNITIKTQNLSKIPSVVYWLQKHKQKIIKMVDLRTFTCYIEHYIICFYREQDIFNTYLKNICIEYICTLGLITVLVYIKCEIKVE